MTCSGKWLPPFPWSLGLNSGQDTALRMVIWGRQAHFRFSWYLSSGPHSNLAWGWASPSLFHPFFPPWIHSVTPAVCPIGQHSSPLHVDSFSSFVPLLPHTLSCAELQVPGCTSVTSVWTAPSSWVISYPIHSPAPAHFSLSFSFKLDITFLRYALVIHFNVCIPPCELSKHLLSIIIIC